MKFSGLIFPFPNPPTYSHDRLVGELLYVPKDFNSCPYKYMESSRTESKISVGKTLNVDGVNSATNSAAKPMRILKEINNNGVSDRKIFQTPNLASSSQAKFFDH